MTHKLSHSKAETQRMWKFLSEWYEGTINANRNIRFQPMNCSTLECFAVRTHYSVVRYRALRGGNAFSKRRAYNKERKKLLYFCAHNANSLICINGIWVKVSPADCKTISKAEKFAFFSLNQKEIIHLHMNANESFQMGYWS